MIDQIANNQENKNMIDNLPVIKPAEVEVIQVETELKEEEIEIEGPQILKLSEES